jgi:O-antigen/teichoic acid export membrane protein
VDVADKIRSGARWLGAAKLVTQIYTWILTVMVMRLLVPEDYALMAMAGVFMGFVAQFEDLGVRVKLVQMPEYTRDYARSVFGLVLVTNLALVALLTLAAPFIADFFSQPRLVAIIATLSLGLMISAWGSIPDAFIKRQLDFRSLAIVDVVRAVVTSTSTLALAYFEFGVWSLVWGVLIGTIVGTVGRMIASPFRALPSFNFRGLDDTLRFGGLVMLQRLGWWAYSGLDSVLIGRFYPASALGTYSLAASLATMPLEKVGQIFNVLSFTGLSRVNQDRETFRHYMRRGTRLVGLILFPVFIGIAAIGVEFEQVVLGEKWTGVGTLAGVLALAALPRCVSVVLNESLNSLGKPLLLFQCVMVTTVLFAVGIVSGLPFGLQAVASGVAAAAGLALLNNVRVVSRELEIPMTDLLAGLWRPALASLVMLAALSLVRPLVPVPYPSWGGLLFTVGLGAAIYGGLIVMFDRHGFLLLRGLVPSRS